MNSTEFWAAISGARQQHRAGAGSVIDVLLRTAGIDAAELRQLLPSSGGVEVLLLASEGEADYARLDLATARQLGCVAVSRPGQTLLAMEDPWDEPTLRRARALVGQAAIPAAATRDALNAWLDSQRPLLPSHIAPATPAVRPDDGPIVAFVNSAISGACTSGASDVHFECDREGVTVKHRLDGVMTRFARLDGRDRADEVISRVKVLAQLDITERRLPQDGRFRFAVSAGSSIDLRVSIMPSVFGEDAVLRLLDKAQLRSQADSVSLGSLGFDDHGILGIRELANAPSGMVLVTGPTGSGKTTTVYAALSEINTGLEKIITIEDPVEYELPGVLQIPVNERKGLTFAKGLRSILRHDPDRILVGEIRDSETAEIAVQSALTGHLVFTTVHANGLGDIIGRFRHFGIDMFGFMSSLNGVVVQRLLRSLCVHCATRRAPTEAEAQWMAKVLDGTDVAEVHAACGCSQCHETGYSGRFVVAEVHAIDDGFRDLVTEGAPLSALKAYAFKTGIRPLIWQAVQHVVSRRTTLEEVKRVVGWH